MCAVRRLHRGGKPAQSRVRATCQRLDIYMSGRHATAHGVPAPSRKKSQHVLWTYESVLDLISRAAEVGERNPPHDRVASLFPTTASWVVGHILDRIVR